MEKLGDPYEGRSRGHNLIALSKRINLLMRCFCKGCPDDLRTHYVASFQTRYTT